MNTRHRLERLVVLAAVTLSAAAAGCGPEEEPYKARPAVSGKKATLPGVPTLPQKVKKQGDAYTVWGVTHDLRSRVHNEAVNGKKIPSSATREDQLQGRAPLRDPQDGSRSARLQAPVP